MIVSSHQNRFIVHYADQKGCLTVFNCNGKQLAYRPLNEPALVSYVFVDNLKLFKCLIILGSCCNFGW